MLHVYGIVKNRVSSSVGKRDFLLPLTAPLYITLLCQKYGNSDRCLYLVTYYVASTHRYHRMLANRQHHFLCTDMCIEMGGSDVATRLPQAGVPFFCENFTTLGRKRRAKWRESFYPHSRKRAKSPGGKGAAGRS